MALLNRIGFIAIAVLLLLAAPAHAENLQLQEQEIKAGLLYNFLKYTDWPAGAAQTGPMTVCILGDDPFGGYLQPMNGRSVNQREITLHTVHSVSDIAGCHLLFINTDEKAQWPQWRAALSGKSVLTISDFSGFADNGGMIEFGHTDNHISANLNVDALAEAKLHVQDRLLKLVTVMHSASRGGNP